MKRLQSTKLNNELMVLHYDMSYVHLHLYLEIIILRIANKMSKNVMYNIKHKVSGRLSESD